MLNLYIVGHRRLVQSSRRTQSPTICFLFSQINSIQNPCFKLYSTSTSESSSSPSSSFTVSYLSDTCGLSHKEALKSAKKLKLKTADKPNTVINAFQTHGFTKTQIRDIVIGLPLVLMASPQRTLVPKFQFLKEKGFSEDEIAQLFQKGTVSKHLFLGSSLERRIQPCFTFLTTFLQSKEEIALALKRGLFELCPKKYMQPKVEILNGHGVPKTNISALLLFGTRLIKKNNDAFNQAVKDAVEMGVDPSERMFVHVVRAIAEMSKVKREAKIEIYKSFGWTYDEICSAVRKQPTCMAISDEKLKIALEFFMNEMNWEPARLAKAPNVLGLSMDKRIIPRVKILKFLISKGIFDSDTLITNALLPSEANFIEKFIAKYVDRFPELGNMYQGEI